MAAPIKPQKVSANKKDAWWYAPAIADMDVPTSAEINAVSGLNFTCYLLADQAGATATTNKTQLPRLLCETETTEVIDSTTVTLGDLVVLFDPQAAAAADGKKAWELFKDGTSGYLIRRQGVVNDTDSAVTDGQFVDVFKVDTGKANPDKTATDASGVYAATVGVACTDYRFNVEVGGSSSSSSSSSSS